MPFELVRERGKLGHLPDTDTLTKCMDVATTPEAAQYFLAGYEECVKAAKKSGEEVVQKILGTIRGFVEFVVGKSAGDYWSGKEPPTAFQKYQQTLAANATQALGEKHIILDFSVSDQSELMRGYSTDDGTLDEKGTDAMDKLFNAWLTENHMISKGGVIYEGTKNGEVKQDNDGNPVRANPDLLREKVGDDKHGFEQYVSKNGKSTQVTTTQHDFYTDQQPKEVDTGISATSRGGGAG